jgi:hypothetical protein
MIRKFAVLKSKLIVAMCIYAVLAVIAMSVLHGAFRLAILVLLGGLAIKTLIARAAGW